MTMLVSAHAGMATNPDKEKEMMNMMNATSLDDAAEDAEDDGQDS